MSQDFTFSESHIDDHIEKVGVDVRPGIECKMEKQKLMDFGNDLTAQFPNLYESLVISPDSFSMRKKFIFSGKGEIDLVTLAISQIGVVFFFPHKTSVLGEEFDSFETRDIITDCMGFFRKKFPDKKIVRIGLINEYIYDVGPIESVKLISDRFMKATIPPDGEITIRINKPTDDYNRNIIIEALRKTRSVPEIPGARQATGFGVKVVVDFNNRELSENLEKDKILSVLHEGKRFNKKDLYKFLNREDEGEN